jgi:hypothetical protein
VHCHLGLRYADFANFAAWKTQARYAPTSLKQTARSHDDTDEDPSEKYARRPRHRTREDRYEYKDVSEKRSKTRLSRSLIKTNPAATLTRDFQAPNVAVQRLTLKCTGPGFLQKGKSSGNAERRGLPDLTFSEMAFLKRKRGSENTKRGESRPKQKHRQSPIQEISAFFSRPDDQQHKATSAPKPSAVGSYVSWSVSSPRSRPAPTGQRSSLFVQSLERGDWREDVGGDLEPHASTCPNSPPIDRFLRDMTTDALLCGVDTYARREKRYYSLEDLKMLAEDTTIETPPNQKALYGFNMMRNANSLTRPSPHSDEPEETNSVRRARELSAHPHERRVGHDTECLQPGPSLPKDHSVVGPSGHWSQVMGALAPSSSDMDDFDRDLWQHWAGGSACLEKDVVVDEDISSHDFGFERPSARGWSNYWSHPTPAKDEDRQVAYDSIETAVTAQLHEAATDGCTPRRHPRFLRGPRHVVEDPVVGFSGFTRAQIL